MGMPHVFIARETARTPRMFMTKPVFAWENRDRHEVRRWKVTMCLRHKCWCIYHVFDHQMSWCKGDGVGRRRHWQHEGIWTSYCCRYHEVQRVYRHANSLQRQRQNRDQHIVNLFYMDINWLNKLYNILAKVSKDTKYSGPKSSISRNVLQPQLRRRFELNWCPYDI